MYLATGIATEPTGKRPDARHTLTFYASGASLNDARQWALQRAATEGWLHVSVSREKETGTDTDLISNETLRSAAEGTIVRGTAIVV
jgi:hypothetical protein